MAWTEERCERLRFLWDRGDKASEIAAQLGGVTRDAVIGKAHRMGLKPRRGVDAEHPLPLQTKAAAKKAPAKKPERQNIIRLAPVVNGLLTTADLRPGVCHWPLGDPKQSEHIYCGEPADGRYCERHHGVAVIPTRPLNVAGIVALSRRGA